MKNKAFSLVEILIVSVIASSALIVVLFLGNAEQLANRRIRNRSRAHRYKTLMGHDPQQVRAQLEDNQM